MSKEFSRENILYVFNELVTNATKFMPDTLQQERNEAYKQIEQIIKEYPYLKEKEEN